MVEVWRGDFDGLDESRIVGNDLSEESKSDGVGQTEWIKRKAKDEKSRG